MMDTLGKFAVAAAIACGLMFVVAIAKVVVEDPRPAPSKQRDEYHPEVKRVETPKPRKPTPSDRELGPIAWEFAKMWAEEKLASPGSAEWPGWLERHDHVTALGNARYRVRTWVDSQNAFGALVRTNVDAVIVVTQDPSGDYVGKAESFNMTVR